MLGNRQDLLVSFSVKRKREEAISHPDLEIFMLLTDAPAIEVRKSQMDILQAIKNCAEETGMI